MIKAQTLKGFRDFLPKEVKKREYVINTLKRVFESYGFEPIETPALEYEEILAGKYGGEGEKLMYRFIDKGGRKVALKFDQTVPLARFISQYQNDIPLPLKRYQIQEAWRAENTQKGRYREFTQCDIDIVGVDSPISDFELLEIATNVYRKLGFKNIKILINDRVSFADIPTEALAIIDKLKKIGENGVKKELKLKGFKENLLEKTKNNKPTERVKKVLELAKSSGFEKEIIFTQTLARGLDYYTGIIMEAEAENYSGGSLGGGGRYNKLISLFTGIDIPAVGFSFGFDRIIDAMDDLGLFPTDLEIIKVLVTYSQEALEIARKFRDAGINTQVYPEEKDLEKQLKYADKKQIPYVIILSGEKLILRNMKKRIQEEITIEKVIKKLSPIS
ncbi:MAG: histidine--tRNA ligase [Candidatus Levybacteria bacterium RBG_16_35_11]|nr:MAG: histidine--tRNA ligase [Candidatus Levybacteria bacterium RBG_16_35_11]